jgi:peptide/nickel transport system substrate-binding protein
MPDEMEESHMEPKREISRRQFICLGTLAAAGAVAAACTPSPTPTVPPTAATKPTVAPPTAVPPTAVPQATVAPQATAAPTAVVSKYKEAPMLADLVKAGKLPPVDQRLPKIPCVMTSYEGAGTHGGTWRRAFQGVSDINGPTKVLDRAWGWFDKSLNLQPRQLESWSVSADGKVWTIKMRQGLKWSDGKAEYTTDDIAFWYQYELQNKKLTPGLPTQWTDPDKTLVKFAAVDKYTATFTYTKPKPMFIYNMTRYGNGNVPSQPPSPCTPSAYLKQFHEDLTTDKAALDADVKKSGFADWQTYYMQFKRSWTANPDKPTIGGWVAKNDHTSELFTIERNPYFFAVDPQGNQLPYIDKVTHRLYQASAPDVLTLRVTNGEIDMQYRQMQIANLPVYKASETKGDYKTILGLVASHVCVNFNLTTKNKPLNEFFNQRDARIAMSLAVNRDNMNQLVYNGLLKPRQYSPISASPQYYEKLTKAYINYDPDTANKMLDAAGYSKKDANGIRLYKDGSGPISFSIESITAVGTQDSDACGLAIKDWAKIGIKVAYKFVDRSLYTQHYDANDIEAGWFGADRALLPIVPEAIIFRGMSRDRPWCPGWSYYYVEPKNVNAVQPPDGHWIYSIWKIWDEEVAVEPDSAKQTAAFKKILDIWATELPFITFLGELPAPTIVKNGFKGYPAGMPNDDTVGDEHFCQSETYYWDDPSKHTG